MTVLAASLRNPRVLELIRFGTVGACATALYLIATHALQDYARMSVPVAASVAFVLIVAMNYVLHYSWTFRSSRPHRSAVPRFVATALGAMAINFVAVTVGQRWLPFSQTGVLLLGVVLVVGWNYLLSRFWVFVDRDRQL